MRMFFSILCLVISDSGALQRHVMNIDGVYIGKDLSLIQRKLKSDGFFITESEWSIRASDLNQLWIISCDRKDCLPKSRVKSIYSERKEADKSDCIKTFNKNLKVFGPPRVGIINNSRIAMWSGGSVNLSLQCVNGFIENNLYRSGDVYFGNIKWIDQGSFSN